MNSHKLIIRKSLIVEGIQLITSVFLNEVDKSYKVYDRLPKGLYEMILKHSLKNIVVHEYLLIMSICESLLFVHERDDANEFKRQLMNLSDDKMRCALTGGVLTLDELNDITEQQVRDAIIKAGVRSVEEFMQIYLSPHSFFESFGKLLCEVVESKEFQNLYSKDIIEKLDLMCKQMHDEMEARHPLSYAQGLMGKSFYNIADWGVYEFIPVEICPYHALRLMDQDTNILLYNVNPKNDPPEEIKVRLVQNMKLISDPKRMELMKLIYAKPMSGKEIAKALNISTATVSHHIEQLRSAGFLNEERDKNTKYFSINQNAYLKITSDLKKYVFS